MRAFPATLLVLVACASDSKNPAPSAREQIYDTLDGRIAIWNAKVTQQNETAMVQEINRNALFVAKHLDALKTDAASAETNYRVKACFALGFSPDDSALPILLKNFEDVSPSVRVNSVASSGMLVYRKVVPRDRAPFSGYAKLLASRGWEDVHATLFTLSLILNETQDYGFYPQVLPLLKHPRVEVRNEAVKLLGLLQRPESYESLRDLMKDPEPLIRLNAVVGLARIGKERSIPDLVAAMSDSASEVVQMAVGQIERLAPGGMEFVCEPDQHVQSSNGACPKCGKPLTPRPRKQ